MTLHRYATVVSIFFVLVIAIGASVTTLAEFTATQRAQASSFQSIPTAQAHAVAGIFGTLLVVVLAVWVAFSEQTNAVRFTAWVSVALATISSAAGLADRASASATLAVLHACLAPVILSLLALMIDLTASAGSQSGEPVLLRGGGALKVATTAGPPLALMQIIFGALYRHRAISVLLHMAGALAVSLLTLIVCVVIMQQITQRVPLKTVAAGVMTVILTQISLGIAAFVMRLLDADSGPVFLTLTVLHVTVGSITLASTVLLAINARCLGPAEGDQKIAFGESQ